MSYPSIRSVLLTLLLTTCGYFSFSQISDTRNEIIARIDSVISSSIQKEAFPGAVLLVANRDSMLLQKAYGFQTYDSVRRVQNYHLFDLASVTKVTAGTLALMKLYDQGLISLDQPLKKYVKGFTLNKRGKSTLRRLLSHSSGWRSWIPYYQQMIKGPGEYKRRFFSDTYSEKYSVPIKDDLFLKSNSYNYLKRKIKRADLKDESNYVYSGLFSYLIPELTLRATDTLFNTFLESNFYAPLGATSLTFNPLEKFPDSLIVPTEIDTFFRMEPIRGHVHDEGAILMNGISGNAGLFGTAIDVYKVWNMFLNDGRIDSTTYLSGGVIDLFTTMQYPNENNRRGLGFDKPLINYDEQKSSVDKEASLQSYGHSGYTGPLVWADPKNDIIFVFLCNRVYPNRLQRQIYELNVRPVLHGLSYELRKTYELGYLE